jgi:hypothetical protein
MIEEKENKRLGIKYLQNIKRKSLTSLIIIIILSFNIIQYIIDNKEICFSPLKIIYYEECN